MSTEFLLEQIEKTKTIIININTAINTILLGAQSYRLNTGQSEQWVTRANIDELQKTRQALLSELTTLESAAGINNRAVITVRPAY